MASRKGPNGTVKIDERGVAVRLGVIQDTFQSSLLDFILDHRFSVLVEIIRV